MRKEGLANVTIVTKCPCSFLVHNTSIPLFYTTLVLDGFTNIFGEGTRFTHPIL